MMSLSYVLAIAAIGAAIWGTVAAVMIIRFLDQRGIKTPIILYRVFFFINARRYRQVTADENGKPGRLYYHCVYAFNAALILGLAALAVTLL